MFSTAHVVPVGKRAVRIGISRAMTGSDAMKGDAMFAVSVGRCAARDLISDARAGSGVVE